ncbi:DUF4089 domain-containing protein [Sphingomonas oleivorans]|uniref:DUF4089 domain-containing protein n=1 Tax=Sphingomonas oleivorans TaxID=1735121 RepID=A0A2T5FYC3_9SPHN|nr:DUF4089 domain-containing protein [Sphingomonas oleivorans]PTQ11516.1 DUF4089 domain-containing protein [Sphingomonas oleivorans]
MPEHSTIRDHILAQAAALDLPLDEACLPGIDSNMALLGAFADLLHAFPLPPEREPAPEYRP